MTRRQRPLNSEWQTIVMPCPICQKDQSLDLMDDDDKTFKAEVRLIDEIIGDSTLINGTTTQTTIYDHFFDADTLTKHHDCFRALYRGAYPITYNAMMDQILDLAIAQRDTDASQQ